MDEIYVFCFGKVVSNWSTRMQLMDVLLKQEMNLVTAINDVQVLL